MALPETVIESLAENAQERGFQGRLIGEVGLDVLASLGDLHLDEIKLHILGEVILAVSPMFLRGFLFGFHLGIEEKLGFRLADRHAAVIGHADGLRDTGRFFRNRCKHRAIGSNLQPRSQLHRTAEIDSHPGSAQNGDDGNGTQDTEIARAIGKKRLQNAHCRSPCLHQSPLA